MKKIVPFALAVIIIAALVSCRPGGGKYSSWETYKGSDAMINYSSLKQVDTANVKQLAIAWTYHTGDADTLNHSQIQCNPIIIDGILYGTSPKMKLFAIDAATGRQKWLFNPFDSLSSDKRMFFILNNSRGVTYWEGGGDKRIYYTAGPYLYAINALTGKPVDGFADKGKLDLHNGLGRDVHDLFVTATSPPVIYNNTLIMGSRVDEGPHSAPGHIRGYDVRTGKQLWIFHTLPQPGEANYNTWPDPKAYTFIGGANAWSGLTLDRDKGIVFACTGSATYDWYGGKRKGDDLYADCVLALNAGTGKLLWHFQDVHHDVWDRDLSSPPVLVTLDKEGRKVDALAVTTKTGFVFVFDRMSGKPVYDIAERPVPFNTDLQGEQLARTQPYPLKPAPFMRQLLTEKDINPFLPPASYQEVKKRWQGYRHDHMYNPPSLQGTVVFPGLDGGGEWGGPSFDPETGLLYINANEMAWVIQAVPLQNKSTASQTNLQAGVRLFSANCMSCHGADRNGSGNFPSLINAGRKYNAAVFDTLLQTGRRMMPSFRQLSKAERAAIASFVLNLTGQQNKPFTDTTAAGGPYNLPYTIVGYNKFLSKEGYPALSPPWGTLNALNLNTGKYVWKQPLGNDPEFPHGKQASGAENYGAGVVTAGGLIFIAATKDGKFRAFNKTTGKLLWQVTLPSPGYATPAVYSINGKQYIVIACGGGKMNTRSGDSYVAFALTGK